MNRLVGAPNDAGREHEAERRLALERATLKPIAFALALAILICAVPVAYRISLCPNFSTGLSLNVLFSFKCEATPKTVESPAPADKTDAVDKDRPSTEALLAATLTPPQGYVAYRVDSGLPRGEGALKAADNTPAPPFAEVKDGLILKATADKILRSRPFGTSDDTTEPRGQCFEVIAGTRIRDEQPKAGRSGG